MPLLVEILWIKSVPPFAFAISLGQFAVVGHARERAGFVRTLGDFIPAPRVSRVQADTKRQALIFRRLGPAGNEILLRADLHGVPRLIRAVPQIKVVMVVAESDKVLCAGALVEGDEFFGVPFLR